MDIKLAWLSGIVESEGCFTMCKASVNLNKRKHFTFCISITNTDLMILNECISILKNINVETHLHKRKIYFEHRKIGYNLNINGIDNLIKTFNAIMPYLIGQKKSQANLLLEFLIRRKTLMDKNIGNSARRIAYDEIDYSYLKSFQELKSITESVETRALSIPKKTVKKCIIEGCNAKYYSKDYCQKHYDKAHYRLLRDKDTVQTNGQPLEVAEMTTRLNLN